MRTISPRYWIERASRYVPGTIVRSLSWTVSAWRPQAAYRSLSTTRAQRSMWLSRPCVKQERFWARVMDESLRDLYQEVILDHSRHPRHFGPLAAATHHGEGYNPLS